MSPAAILVIVIVLAGALLIDIAWEITRQHQHHDQDEADRDRALRQEIRRQP